MSEQELFQLIFLPGFSTVEKVTDISGRGVGMDVVKKNVEAAGGTIEIESVKGAGTRFTLSVPKSITVKIIEGVLVAVGQQRFVLPLKAVGESFEIKPEMVTRLPDGRACVKRHDSVYPLMWLSEVLAIDCTGQAQRNQIGIMVFHARRSTVLIVDEILGLQQVVVKKIEGTSVGSEMISGGAILGDEKVAIVLDAEKLHQ
jgi:two-component system, chemotaxis family, sensor kinase CheA